MSYHGSPLDSLANAVERAKKRQQHIERRKQQVREKQCKPKRKYIRNREAYDTAIKFNEEHDIGGRHAPAKLLPAFSILRASQGRKNQKKVRLAGEREDGNFNAVKKQRLEAEQRMVERLKQALESLTFGIHELMNISNEAGKKRDNPLGVSMDRLIDLTRLIATAARMPVPEFSITRQGGASPSEKHCNTCGCRYVGLGTICDECKEDKRLSRVAEQSAQRRSSEQTNRGVIKDIKRVARLIDEVQKKGRAL